MVLKFHRIWWTFQTESCSKAQSRLGKCEEEWLVMRDLGPQWGAAQEPGKITLQVFLWNKHLIYQSKDIWLPYRGRTPPRLKLKGKYSCGKGKKCLNLKADWSIIGPVKGDEGGLSISSLLRKTGCPEPWAQGPGLCSAGISQQMFRSGSKLLTLYPSSNLLVSIALSGSTHAEGQFCHKWINWRCGFLTSDLGAGLVWVCLWAQLPLDARTTEFPTWVSMIQTPGNHMKALLLYANLSEASWLFPGSIALSFSNYSMHSA